MADSIFYKRSGDGQLVEHHEQALDPRDEENATMFRKFFFGKRDTHRQAVTLSAAIQGRHGTFIATIVDIFGNYEAITTEVLVASVRHPMHIIQAAEIGADVCTVPPDILKKLVSHPLTDKGLAAFLADWEKTGQKIL